MANKDSRFDDIIGRAQEATRKTRELLQEAHSLHDAADAAHKRAAQVHGTIIKQRQQAETRRNSKTRNK